MNDLGNPYEYSPTPDEMDEYNDWLREFNAQLPDYESPDDGPVAPPAEDEIPL